jgi:hypothetical protein
MWRWSQSDNALLQAMLVAAADIRRTAILRHSDGTEDRHICPDQDTAVRWLEIRLREGDEIFIVNTWMMKPPKPPPEPSRLNVKSQNKRED